MEEQNDGEEDLRYISGFIFLYLFRKYYQKMLNESWPCDMFDIH